MTDLRKPIFDQIRALRGKGFTPHEVDLLDDTLDQLDVPREGATALADPQDPEWLAEARKLIGMREIPGPQHNSWIVSAWARLGAGWFNDDETPWCGLFTAHCIDSAGLPYPRSFPRAKSWASWGKACPPLLGAVAVFSRNGGGHVGFLVGESARQWYVLGGNQRNEVNIMPLDKDRLVSQGMRWPMGKALGTAKPPAMSGGVISVNEQ